MADGGHVAGAVSIAEPGLVIGAKVVSSTRWSRFSIAQGSGTALAASNAFSAAAFREASTRQRVRRAMDTRGGVSGV